MLGLTFGDSPKFARRYVNIAETIVQAVRRYCDDVQTGNFPTDAESYHAPASLKGRDANPILR